MTDLSDPRPKTVKALAALSGNHCAFPKCPIRLWDPELETFVGEVAHIHGQRPGSARFHEALTSDEIHGISNLLLMCANHHKVIDDHPETYPVELLEEWKRFVEEGPLEAPDDVFARIVRELLEQQHADIGGLVRGLAETTERQTEALLQKDLPIVAVVSTGGKGLPESFAPQWGLAKTAGQDIGSVHYRYRLAQVESAPPAWKFARVERKSHGSVASTIEEFDLKTRVAAQLVDWPELGECQVGLEVCFEYAGDWWRRRFIANFTVDLKVHVAEARWGSTERITSDLPRQ